MKKEEFIKVLKKEGYSYEIEGDKILVTYQGSVHLGSLKTLPPGVEFRNGGGVGLRSLETLPPGVEFRNGGGVGLYSLKTLPPGVTFRNRGTVFLRSLKTIPSGVEFSNSENVNLSALKTLPPGVEFMNGGSVYFGGILGGWLEEWEGNIEGVDGKRILNLMTNKGLFL